MYEKFFSFLLLFLLALPVPLQVVANSNERMPRTDDDSHILAFPVANATVSRLPFGNPAKLRPTDEYQQQMAILCAPRAREPINGQAPPGQSDEHVFPASCIERTDPDPVPVVDAVLQERSTVKPTLLLF